MGDTAADPLSRITQNHFTSIWVICVFPFDDNAQAAHLKQNIRAMSAMHENRFRISRYA
jgi:hypothetical protein